MKTALEAMSLLNGIMNGSNCYLEVENGPGRNNKCSCLWKTYPFDYFEVSLTNSSLSQHTYHCWGAFDLHVTWHAMTLILFNVKVKILM